MTGDGKALVESGPAGAASRGVGIESVAGRLNEEFASAVDLLYRASGRVIVSGVGKSGLIARKIAATLTSTGTSASYLHPIDSLHGDLGIVGRNDVAIVLSKSGESQDLFGLLGSLQRMGVPDHRHHRRPRFDARAGGHRHARWVRGRGSLSARPGAHFEHDGRARAGRRLAVALLEVKGFRREDFAALHPGGSLGRRLLLRVRDVMLTPGRILRPDATMREAVVSLAHDRGLAMVAADGRLEGVLTTGDLTRLAEREPAVFWRCR